MKTYPVRPALSGMNDVHEEAGVAIEGEVVVDKSLEVAQDAGADHGQGAEVGAQEGQEDAADEHEYGERRPKPGRQPRGPTQAEIDEHYPLHVHYRSWCPHCRAGRSLGKQHRSADGSEADIGICISLDYAFQCPEEIEDGTPPILVAVDGNSQSTKAMWSLQVDAKGVEANVGVEWLYKKLEFAGYSSMMITLKSDNEPFILAVKKALAIKRRCETSLIKSPVRESKCNGREERAIRSWRDQSRTMRHDFEHRSKVTLSNNSPLSSWLVGWASEALNK